MDIIEELMILGGGNLTEKALKKLIKQAGGDRYNVIRACAYQLTDKEVLKMKNGEWLRNFFLPITATISMKYRKGIMMGNYA
jgi:hypothetical protein